MKPNNIKINKSQRLNFNKKKINKEGIKNTKIVNHTINQSFQEILDEEIKIYKKRFINRK